MKREIKIASKELLGDYINLKVIYLIDGVEVASMSVGGKTKEEIDTRIQEWSNSLEAAQIEFQKITVGEVIAVEPTVV